MSATGPKPPPPPRSKKSRKPAPRPPSDRSNQLDPLGDPYGAAPSMASNPYGFDSYAPPKAKPPGGAGAPPPKPSGDPYGGAGGAYGGDDFAKRGGEPEPSRFAPAVRVAYAWTWRAAADDYLARTLALLFAAALCACLACVTVRDSDYDEAQDYETARDAPVEASSRWPWAWSKSP